MFPTFTEDQTTIREAARDFAMSEIDPGAAARDASSEFATDIIRQLGEMGFMGMVVPEAYGGAGVDFLSYILALEQVAYADASVAVAMSVNNSVSMKPPSSSPLARGRRYFCFWASVPKARMGAQATELFTLMATATEASA